MVRIAQVLVHHHPCLVKPIIAERGTPVSCCGETCHIQHPRFMYSHVREAPIRELSFQ